MNLNEMQMFVEVSRETSFTAAAKNLGIPKSTVSRAILNLESRLGVRLLERTTRNVRLTDAGELYLDRCSRMLTEAEEADLLMSSLQGKPRGRLRIGAPIAFIRFSLGPRLPEFLAKFPDISVNLRILSGLPASRENGLDISIRAGELENSELLVKPLKKIRLALYASSSFLQKHGTPRFPSDLRGKSCITTSCGALGPTADGSLWRLRRGSEAQEVRVESRVAVPDPLLNYDLALKGIGIAQLSQTIVEKHKEKENLIRVLPEWEPETVALCALYPSGLSASPKVRAFLSFLEGAP